MTVVGVVVNLVTLPMTAPRFEIFIIVKKTTIMMMGNMMNTLRWSHPLRINQWKNSKTLNKNSQILFQERPPLQKKVLLYLSYADFSPPKNKKKRIDRELQSSRRV